MKKKAQDNEMAKGGMCAAHGAYACHMCHGGKMYAAGGEVDAEHEDERMLDYEDSEQDEAEDMVGRIMRQRMEGSEQEDMLRYADGGDMPYDEPRNEEEPVADFEPNDFERMNQEEVPQASYTGENSGDEIGNEMNDEEMRDIVERIMRQRRMKPGMSSGSNERIA